MQYRNNINVNINVTQMVTGVGGGGGVAARAKFGTELVYLGPPEKHSQKHDDTY
jgi:hypothetical protein